MIGSQKVQNYFGTQDKNSTSYISGKKQAPLVMEDGS